MKTKQLIGAFIISATLASCGGAQQGKSVDEIIENNDLVELKEKHNELITQEHELAGQIEKLGTAIALLDSHKVRPLVSVYTVKTEEFKHYVEVQGSIDTKQNIVLFPEYAGVLTKVLVKEGQQVSSGQLLATIEDGGLAQQVNQMEIQADLSRTTFDRQKRLWDQKIGSEMQFLQAKANYEAQQKSVSQLKSQLEKTQIRAPFSGIVDEIMIDEGNVVGPGQMGVMRLINMGQMFVESDVPETYISAIAKGRSVQVEIPVLNQTIDGIISQASNYIKPDNRSFRVEAVLQNKDGMIKPNMTARLKINDYTSENALLIPQSIISEDSEGKQYVYKVNSKNTEPFVERVFIKTGKKGGDFIEVLEGLSPNDQVIKEGARTVKDKQEIEIIKQ
jgi:RND family efflux transporter MFP subunit